eukprot:1063244-Pyramimonas_sp.AAC.1
MERPPVPNDDCTRTGLVGRPDQSWPRGREAVQTMGVAWEWEHQGESRTAGWEGYFQERLGK